MKVMIDPAIERDGEILDAVRHTNSQLSHWLGDLDDTVEVNWSLPSDRRAEVVVQLKSLDDAPGEATVTVPVDVLKSADRRYYPISDVLSRMLDQRTTYRLRKVRRMLAEAEA